jgi:hypothetical protein
MALLPLGYSTIADEFVPGASLDLPPVDGCTYPQSSNLTILCPSLYPACPSPTAARAAPQSYAQWTSNTANGYCPPYCLDPLRFDNSLTKVTTHTHTHTTLHCAIAVHHCTCCQVGVMAHVLVSLLS